MKDQVEIDPRTGRLSVATVRQLERLLGGDPEQEEQIIGFIGVRYGASNMLELPVNVAAEALRRPGDFANAAREWRLQRVEC